MEPSFSLALAVTGLLLGTTPEAAPVITWAADSGVPRVDHGAALLPDGRVLVEGYPEPLSQLYDPAADAWSDAGISISGHAIYSLVRLRDGRVLTVDNSTVYEWWSPEDPVWTVAPTGARRQNGVAMLLEPSGRLLTGCGDDGTGLIVTFELFDEDAGTWSDAGSHFASGTRCAISPLPGDGWLKTGGTSSSGPVAEVWSADGGRAGVMQYARSNHTSTVLPDRRVLITGGTDPPVPVEIFDPATGAWEALGATPSAGRFLASATVLPDGRVLVAGGQDGSSVLGTAELFDPLTGLWSAPFQMGTPRTAHLAVMLANGRVLLNGGDDGVDAVESSELLDFSSPFVVDAPSPSPAPLAAPRLGVARGWPVLWDDHGAAAYRLGAQGQWTSLPPPPPNPDAVALTLMDGRLLRVGAAIDGFDPALDAWFTLPAPAVAHPRAAAALLGTGEVLVAGGDGPTAAVELLDPRTATWSATDPLPYPTRDAQAISLPGGDVLLCGGEGTTGVTDWCWVYSGAVRRWASGVRLSAPRRRFSLTLLESGRALAAGGENDAGLAAGAELFEPASTRWTQVGPLSDSRSGHAAIRLRNGQVLVLGGAGAEGALGTTERFDPVAGAFTAGPPLGGPRAFPAVAMAADGQVLICGAEDGRLERFDEGRGALPQWAPVLGPPPGGSPGGVLTVTGALLTGVTPGSSGNLRDSPGNLPVLALVGADGVMVRPGALEWTPSTVTFRVPAGTAPGWVALSASVNGIEGGAQPLAIGAGPGQACDASADCSAGACSNGTCAAPPETVWTPPDAGPAPDAGSAGDAGADAGGGPPLSVSVGCGGCASAPAGAWGALLLAAIALRHLRRSRRRAP